MSEMTRREASLGLLSVPLLAGCHSGRPGEPASSWSIALERIEAQRGGRIGVAAMDLQSGTFLGHRADERFAMCSTFKWILGGLILLQVEAGQEDLQREVAIASEDMIFHAPTTAPAVGSSLTIETLCAATIANSDNPAANLLLKTLGGPTGFTKRLRDLGDDMTRLDRYEPDLNIVAGGDMRDTTTPRAMLTLMRGFVFGEILQPRSRTILRDWMLGATSGTNRLTVGLPDGWRLGHKTGTNSETINNDVGFALPPMTETQTPIVVISFSDAPGAFSDPANKAHANVMKQVFESFTRV